MKINNYGTGNSKTNSLFWIMNNDDVDNDFDSNFRYTDDASNNNNNNDNDNNDTLIPSSCNRVSTCDAIGEISY